MRPWIGCSWGLALSIWLHHNHIHIQIAKATLTTMMKMMMMMTMMTQNVKAFSSDIAKVHRILHHSKTQTSCFQILLIKTQFLFAKFNRSDKNWIHVWNLNQHSTKYLKSSYNCLSYRQSSSEHNMPWKNSRNHGYFLHLIEMVLSGARQNVNGFQSFKSFSKSFVNRIKVEKSRQLVKAKKDKYVVKVQGLQNTYSKNILTWYGSTQW